MKIGFIGSGNMTSAIVTGMLKNDFSPQYIYLSDKNKDLLATKQKLFKTNICTSIEVTKDCAIIFLAIKPQVLSSVCVEIKKYLNPDSIIVSIVAGVDTNKLQTLLNTKNIIRTMPNTPAMIGLGATGIFSLIGKNSVVDKIFNSFGISCWVKKEEQINTITALSGSGPAYFFLMFEAMIESAKKMGLDENLAKKLCLQTAIGSGKMALNSNDIKALRENVTSQGGTTQAALDSFFADNFVKIIDNAMISAKNRANEISNSF